MSDSLNATSLDCYRCSYCEQIVKADDVEHCWCRDCGDDDYIPSGDHDHHV